VSDPVFRLRLTNLDHTIVEVASRWWGRDVLPGLPRFFLDHFWATSLCAEDAESKIVDFLVGFHSPSEPTEAYIH